jgi:hypothetical protein
MATPPCSCRGIRAFAAAMFSAASWLMDGAAVAQEIKLTRSAPSGIETLLVDERSWDSHCRPLATSIKVINQPSNGSVKIVPGSSIVATSVAASTSIGQCAGRSITGQQIVYRSNPGFRGVDTLAYRAFYGNGRSGSTTVTINVR